jgi:hypothetical protein
MSRIAYGFISLVVIIGIFALCYIILNPLMASLYAVGQQLTPELIKMLDFLQIAWNVLPLAVLISVAMWAVVAGMGNATNPGRICIAWLIVLSSIILMMIGYVSLGPLFETILNMVESAGFFPPATNFAKLVWYNYPIPLLIVILLWAFVQSIFTEPNTEYI